MPRLERLYALNEQIRRSAPQPVSAAALAARFEVSRRTIERDLATLRESGVPLYAERGRNGGQRTLQNAEHIVFTLRANEVSALLIAVAAAGDMPFGDAASTATQRLLDAIPDTTRMQVDQLRSRIRSRTTDDHKTAARVRRSIEEAVRAQLVVNISYRDGHGQQTKRAVEACGLLNGAEGWYLIGWCRLRDAGRIFRLDRIHTAQLTTEHSPNRDLDDVLGWTPNDVTTP